MVLYNIQICHSILTPLLVLYKAHHCKKISNATACRRSVFSPTTRVANPFSLFSSKGKKSKIIKNSGISCW